MPTARSKRCWRGARDGIGDDTELEDLAKAKLLAVCASRREGNLVKFMYDSYDKFTDSDWRARVIYALHPVF